VPEAPAQHEREEDSRQKDGQDDAEVPDPRAACVFGVGDPAAEVSSAAR
jgi:hypothetical protein